MRYHEAIDDKETFEVVQKKSRSRHTKGSGGYATMFSGSSTSTEIGGSKMTFHRQMAQKRRERNIVSTPNFWAQFKIMY